MNPEPNPPSPHLPWAQPAQPGPPTHPTLPGFHAAAPVPVVAADRHGPGLALAAFVIAIIALLGAGVAGIGVLAGGGVPFDPGGDGGGPLTGTLTTASAGRVDGIALATAVRNRIADDGGTPQGIHCPGSAVDANVTAVCHGLIDGDEYAIVVFFENAKGDYTLLPA